MIGSISFSGSVIAFGKLQGIVAERAITVDGPEASLNVVLFVGAARLPSACIAAGGGVAVVPDAARSAALVFGVLMVIPIGGADMPVVISLLNSFTGLAAAATGFVLAQQRADHQRRAGRRLGHAAHACSCARR